MKHFIYLITILFFSFQGCLVFEKVKYEINMETAQKGVAKITFYNIQSDAIGNKEFEEDKNILFDFMLKSDEFIYSWQDEGKDIISRKLFVTNDKLNGEVIYKFDQVSIVEGIMHQDGFYFLTLQLEDSVLSTNGTLIYGKEYKRIMWDDTIHPLRFEMLSDIKQTSLRPLSPFYKE